MTPVLALSETAPSASAATVAQALTAPAPVGRLPLSAQGDELGPTARRLLTGGVLAAHVLGGWALLQVDAVRQAVIEAAPIMVSMIDAPEPPKPAPPPPPPVPQPRKVQPAPVPLLAAAPSPTPAPASFVVPAPDPVPPTPTLAPAPPAPPAPAAPPAAPALKKVAPSAVRYLVEPRLNFPLLAKRAGESGVVLLRIVVDAKGNLRSASIAKSSGFARIDEQALLDIRSARFVPQTDNGQPVDWETTAGLSYEL